MHILNKILEDKTQRVILIIASIFVALGIYVMNVLYPVYADDWVYTLLYESNPHRQLVSFSDLIVSQYNHYMLWGGRTVAHTIAQLLLWLPPFVHDILNTLAFLAFVYVIYKIGTVVDRKVNGLLFLMIACLLWIFTDPMIFSSAIWITGSANYLWTSLIILLFIYPFIKYLVSETSGTGQKKWMNILMPFVGLLAGWTNENSVLALLFFLIAFFIICKVQKKAIPLWSILATITSFVGCLFLLLAPGNFLRLQGEIVDEVVPQEGMINLWIYRVSNLLSTLKTTYTLYLTTLLLIVVGLYMIFNRGWNADKRKQNTVHLSLLMLIMAYISAASMMAAPMISYRTLFFTNSLLIVSIALLFMDVYRKNSLTQLGGLTFIILLFSFTCYDYSKKYATISFISDLWEERDEYIESEKAKGNYDIVFPTTFTAHPKFLLNEMKTDMSDSRNQFYSIYKGVNSIRSDSTAVQLQTP